jgi:hypothetical protein
MRYDDVVDKSVRRGRIIAGHPGHLMRLKHGAIMLSYGNRNKDNLGVDVMFSDDEGKTWRQPYRILKVGTADSGYPSSVQLDNGNILTAYYSKITPYHRGYHMGIVIWDPAKTRSQ